MSQHKSLLRFATAGALATLLPAATPAQPAATTLAAPAANGVQRLTLVSREPAFDGQSFGTVGPYERLLYKVDLALDPKLPVNADLPLIAKAPRNAAGLVAFATDLIVYRPVDPTKANEDVFYEFVNRATNRSFATLNRASETKPGNGFLMRQGYTIVYAGWQPDAAPERSPVKTYFPRVRNTNGSPVTGRVMESYIPDTPKTNDMLKIEGTTLISTLTYPPAGASPAESGATLTVRQNYDDSRQTLPVSAIRFLNDRQVAIDMSAAQAKGMDAGAIYELIYTVRDPFVPGMGYAGIRDIVSFLRSRADDGAGTANPLLADGRKVRSVVAWGNSLGGRAVRDFLYHGFNADLSGGRVFDGMIAAVAGSRKADHILPFSRTSVWIRQHEERENPGAEFPFTYATSFDPLTGKTDGVLAACTRTATCPKIFHEDSDTESWNGRISLITTDTRGQPIAIPDNVRLYLMSGGSHGSGNGTPSVLPNCKWPSNPIDYSPIYRGLVAAMFGWINDGKTPPASAYPNLKDGTLVSVEQMGKAWPVIAAQPFNPRYATGVIFDWSSLPPKHGKSYPVAVPAIDALGNPTGGVANADVVAPLGTYSGRNYRKVGHAEGELCPGTGGIIPLPPTEAARAQTGDARPSLETLYPKGAESFLAKRREAVDALIADGFVLPEERESYATQVNFPTAP